MSTETIKCIVWDLDETLWQGTLAESDPISLKPGIVEILTTLDARGILHSIASKNNFDDAMRILNAFGIAPYFLYPQIHWSAKSVSIERIREHLNIGLDAMLFIDDQAFEREEVKSVHPDLWCMDGADYRALPLHPRLNPKIITADARRRRMMYLAEMQRKQAEETYQGPHEEFLASLNMRLVISEATEPDLQRAEELTVRTHQLNATGQTYSYEELQQLRASDRHRLYMCELTDTFGSYGKIGLALVELTETHWHLRLLLTSCRVISRGVGAILLAFVMQQAKAAGKPLRADFRQTGRNQMMYITYKFANFQEIETAVGGVSVLENDLSRIPPFPAYVEVMIEGSCPRNTRKDTKEENTPQITQISQIKKDQSVKSA